MTEGPDFVELNEELHRVLAAPDMRRAVDKIRADMDEGDRLYARGVDALRRAANLTQERFAAELGVPHNSMTQMGSRKDPLLSALNSQVQALGLQVELLVTLENGEQTKVGLAHFADRDNPSPTRPLG